jgi:tRNA (Thr-GGU) A37 N-methylase
VRREGRVLRVAELDAVDGTPVLDIKPVMQEFLPRGAVHQPKWCSELMQRYWSEKGGANRSVGKPTRPA